MPQQFDPEAFGKQMAQVVRTAVNEATAPLLKRIEELESRQPEKGDRGEPGPEGVGVADLLISREGTLVVTLADGRTKDLGPVVGKDGRDGIDGQDGKDGVDGKDGRDGIDGKDLDKVTATRNGDTVELGFWTGDVEFAVDLNLPIPKDGRDGVDGKDGKDGIDGKDADMEVLREHLDMLVSEIPVPENGKDGRDGTDGKDGRDGIDADMEVIEEKILSLVTEKVSAIPVPRDGQDGRDGIDGKDGKDGRDGADADMAVLELKVHELVGKIPPPRDGRDGRDGVDGKDADMEAIGRQVKELVEAFPRPKDGKDGLDGKDGKDAYPGEAKGLYQEDGSYRAMDVVTLNGAEWRAKVDNPGPCPGEGWMLSAQRGKRGDKGDKGDPGRPGTPGKDGASLIAFGIDQETMAFEMVLDDGTKLEADFTPVARAIRGDGD
jgi:integrin beta 3